MYTYLLWLIVFFYGVRNDRTLINSLSLKVTHVLHFLVYMGNNGTESETVDHIRIQQQSNYKTCYASSLDNSLDINTFAPSTKNKLICINERAVSEEWCFQCQIKTCFFIYMAQNHQYHGISSSLLNIFHVCNPRPKLLKDGLKTILTRNKRFRHRMNMYS